MTTLDDFLESNPDFREAQFLMKQIIRADLHSGYLEYPKRTWQAVDVRDMTGASSKNWLFTRNNPLNTLILDAHITVYHLNVRKYASEKVWEAATMKMDWEE